MGLIPTTVLICIYLSMAHVYMNLTNQNCIILEITRRNCTCVLYIQSCVIDTSHTLTSSCANMLPGSWRAAASVEHGCRTGPDFSCSIHKNWEYHRQQRVAYKYQCLKSDVDGWVGPKIELKLKAREIVPQIAYLRDFPCLFHSLFNYQGSLDFFHWVVYVSELRERVKMLPQINEFFMYELSIWLHVLWSLFALS